MCRRPRIARCTTRSSSSSSRRSRGIGRSSRRLMGESPDQWPALLDLAVELAEAAGPIALRYFRAPLDVQNKLSAGGFDPVTRADREIEVFIRDAIARRFPD